MPAATALKPATDTAVTSTTASLGDAALTYAGMGLAVFPLAPHSKSPLKGSHGFKDAATDLATVERWWQEHPDANIGLRTGLPSNITVLDVDPRHGGHLTLADLEAKHGPLPYTIESQTGNHGRHLFFQCPDMPIRTGTNALGPGLDIKGNGGYVVLPPSIHPDTGLSYMWEASSEPGMVEVAQMPEWMVESLSSPRTPYPNRSTSIGVCDVVTLGASSKRADYDLALARLLGIDAPVGTKFLCLLHPEKNPSAWLFWGKGGDLLYRCTHASGFTLNIPTLRASLHWGRIMKLRGAQHHHNRLIPLLAAGVVELQEPMHMPLPADAAKPAQAWYKAFLWAVGFNQLAVPGDHGTAFSQRFARSMTKLSESDELAAAKWLLQHDYVQAVGTYKMYGKDCNLLALAPGPGTGIELIDFDEEEVAGV